MKIISTREKLWQNQTREKQTQSCKKIIIPTVQTMICPSQQYSRYLDTHNLKEADIFFLEPRMSACKNF